MTVLWAGDEPIGICVFTTPPLALAGRSRFFGLSGKWSRVKLQSLNRNIAMLSRVVIHPTYRGAGVAGAFIRRSCESCPFPWIETLTQMGRINPFFERAGFQRINVTTKHSRSIESHSAIYGCKRKRNGKKRTISRETFEKSRYTNPVYYIFDNRQATRSETQDKDH